MRALIETDRLVLRPLEVSDARRVAKLSSDPFVARMVSMIPLPNPRVCAEGWILITRARAPLGRERVFAIDLPGEGLIGCVGAHPRGGDIEIGYWLGKAYWGKGFATEAARPVAREADARGRVTAGHFIDNPASGRVLKKAGFDYTGAVEPRFCLARTVKVDTRLMALASQSIH